MLASLFTLLGDDDRGKGEAQVQKALDALIWTVVLARAFDRGHGYEYGDGYGADADSWEPGAAASPRPHRTARVAGAA